MTRWEDQPSATNDFGELRTEFRERLRLRGEPVQHPPPESAMVEQVPRVPLQTRVVALEAALRATLGERFTKAMTIAVDATLKLEALDARKETP